jgi:hypothetical protein
MRLEEAANIVTNPRINAVSVFRIWVDVDLSAFGLLILWVSHNQDKTFARLSWVFRDPIKPISYLCVIKSGTWTSRDRFDYMTIDDPIGPANIFP